LAYSERRYRASFALKTLVSSHAELCNLIAKHRYASLERVNNWNLDFMAGSEQGEKFRNLAEQLDSAMDFMRACGIDEDHPIYKSTEFYTSHESLLLHYEQALTRLDSTTNQWYGCSAHLLWIGERTRQLDCAHIEYMRGINNPIGIKIRSVVSVALATLTASLDLGSGLRHRTRLSPSQHCNCNGVSGVETGALGRGGEGERVQMDPPDSYVVMLVVWLAAAELCPCVFRLARCR
jgi:3-deoxy-D-arabino-heptulosonate 7-phosphate (DAHP) synthase class II